MTIIKSHNAIEDIA